MKSLRPVFLIILLLLLGILPPAHIFAKKGATAFTGDALQPPRRTAPIAAAASNIASRYQPSAFLAGRVAVQIVFVESNGAQEPSITNWTSAQTKEVASQISTALQWWVARLPKARISFDLSSKIVASGYEPITHGLDTEGQWVGDTLNHMGYAASNYFDQAYAAADQLRHDRHTDWATTIFVVNSTGISGGQFADGHFAYAYVNGPFLVITSDAGPYGVQKLAPIAAHEFGHIFGALDQYASAATPCTQQSGYLAIPTTNSQANSCGTRFNSIMLEPVTAYSTGEIDSSALGQVGYHDSDNNNIPDPLDTVPMLQLQLSQPGGGRPTITGQAIDQPFPSPSGESVTLNAIRRVEYRADGGDWYGIPAQDGAYDSANEALDSTLPLYDGAHQIELRAINSIGTSSAVAQYQVNITGVGADPNYQVSMPKLSNQNTINISVVAPAGSAAQIGEDPYLRNASWQPAQAVIPWSVGASDGPRTVYIRLRDQRGVVSPVFVRQITIDRTPPSGRALLHSKPNTWLELVASDSTTQISAMQVSIDGQPSAGWQAFQATTPIEQAPGTLSVRLRDLAGNISEPIDATPVVSVWLPIAMH